MHTYNDSAKVIANAHIHHVSWKNTVGSIFRAASRLHQYRVVSGRMMRDALRELDRKTKQTGCNNE